MNTSIADKYAALRQRLRSLGSAAVAFSGGADSSLLLAVAFAELGAQRCLAVTVASELMPTGELEQARSFCAERGIEHVVAPISALKLPGLADNSPERCYICKRFSLQTVAELAGQRGLDAVVEGSNTDDLGDFRPGRRAVAELGVASPLLEAGLSKAEVRALSRQLGLPTAEMPASACLATRFASGQRLTLEGLKQVDEGEAYLKGLGLGQLRLRVHGSLARIECDEAGFACLSEAATRQQARERLRSLGFEHVTLDLGGYQMGSMNA